jgi:hypothetical protein
MLDSAFARLAATAKSAAVLQKPAQTVDQRETQLRAAVPDRKTADRILRSPAWQDDAQAQSIVNIANVSGPEGDEALAELCEDGDRLTRENTDGLTPLEALESLATQPLNSKIIDDGGGETTRSALVDSTLADVNDPMANVTQNGADTCASTSPQIALARSDPAEYVRLLVGLTGKDGSVNMRGGGRLGLQKESFDDDSIVGEQNRTPSEVIFQGAASEFANGSWLRYDARDDEFATPIAGPGLHVRGLSANMQTSLLQNLFGQQYGTLFGNANLITGGLGRMGAREGQQAHDYLARYDGELPVEMTYRFLGASGGDAFTELHSVLFDHVDPTSGRVYFQNPWGDKPAGSYSAGHVDPAHPDLFYLTQEEFVNNAVWVVAPSGGQYPPPVYVPTGTTTSTSTTTTTSPPPVQTAPPTTVEQGPPTGTTTSTTAPPGR